MSKIHCGASVVMVALLAAAAASQTELPTEATPSRDNVKPIRVRNNRPGWWDMRHRSGFEVADLETIAGSRLTRRARPEDLSFGASRPAQELLLLWESYFASEDAACQDEPYAADVDVSGNVYITGSSTRFPFGSDYLTVKLGPAGNLLWAVRYSGHAEGENISQAVTVDGLGNVYVTGGSPEGHFWDIATVKYNALGVQQWVARWGSEAGLHDGGNAIAVDETGNVFVAGWTMGEDRCYDIVILKYSAQGEERWVRRYEGPPGQMYASLTAMGLAPAASGSIYAAMTTAGEDSSDDILILRLDSDGGEDWRDQFTGPMASDNSFQALAVDPSGALIVGGVSDGWGTEDDFLILKYGSGGFHDWTARYDGPGASGGDRLVDLAVDDSGNVYACGIVDDYSVDGALVCLDRYGNEKWVQYHNAPGTDQDMVGHVRYVPPGDIRLSGEAYQSDPSLPNELFVVQYDTSGNLGWDARRVLTGSTYSSAIDAGWEPGGASYVVAYAGSRAERVNYAVMKVGPGGSVLSESQYDGPGTSYDKAEVGWVHPSGAITLAGWTLAGGAHTRARTVKFEPDGTLAWVQQYYSPEDSSSFIEAITGDKDGNTYVSGYTYEPPSDYDIVTIKYTPEGVEEWKERYISPNVDIPVGIVVDDSGNVYTLGTLEPYSLNAEFQVLKYDKQGTRLWSEKFQLPNGAASSAYAVSAFPGGGICFAGESYTPTQGQAMATVRLRPDGTIAWTAFYSSLSGYRATPQKIVVTDSGITYVAGYVPGQSTGYDPILVRYSSSGDEDWVMTVEGSGAWEGFDDIAAAPWGDVVVLGHIQNDPTQADLLVMRVRADGVVGWREEYASPLDGDDSPSSICYDSLGNIHVTASCETPETMSKDCMIIKYDGIGSIMEIASYPGPGTSMEDPVVFGIDAEGNLLVGGTERGSRSNWSVMRAIKFGPLAATVHPGPPGLPERPMLDQNYPNPFNPLTTIRFAVPGRGHVRLEVFNMLGQEVVTLVDDVLEAGYHSLEFDAARLPSGVYVYRMTAGSVVQSRKMTLLR